MKKLLLITSLFLASILLAQTYQLPLVEVQGEGQIKIPLAQRPSLPYELSSSADSLDHFFPSMHSRYRYTPKPKTPALKGRFEALTGSDWNILLRGSVYDIHPIIPYLRLELDESFLSDSFRSLNHDLYARIDPEGKYEIETSMEYHYADANSYRGNVFKWQLFHHADSLRDANWTLSKLDTRLWWENSSQKPGAINVAHTTPGFWHTHQLSFDNHHIQNQFGSSMGRFAFASTYSLPYGFEGLKYAYGGIMSDMDHLLPLLEARWERIFSPRLMLSAGNYPTLTPHTRAELMREYPWAVQRRIGKNAMTPLNLKIELQRSLPPIFGMHDSHLDISPGNSVKIAFHSSYAYNQATLRVQPFTAIPALSMEPVWDNQLISEAYVRLPWLKLNQTITLGVRHLPHQKWIRAPYSALLSASTKLSYKWRKLDASLSFDQYYNQEGHLGQNLPEVFDLSFGATYQLDEHIMIKAELDNVLNNRHFIWNTLPASQREIRIGARYLWR